MAELDESCLAAGAKASSRLAWLSKKTGNGGKTPKLAPSKGNKIHLPAPVKLSNQHAMSRLFNLYLVF